jgi:hypothetical protein
MDYVYAGSGDDTVVIYNQCELVSGKTIIGGPGEDTIYLPVSLAQAQSMGVYISGFENIETTAAYQQTFSECAQ